MSAKIIPFAEWAAVLRTAPPPEPSSMMIAAAENARLVARLAERNRDAMDRLAEITSDTEAER